MLNEDVLRSCYAFLTTTEPFCRWNLADADDVKFIITGRRDCYGHYRHCTGYPYQHEIMVSMHFVGRTHTLVEVMAHEMIHLFQRETKTDSSTTEHNAAFKNHARHVCRYHGFDPKTF